MFACWGAFVVVVGLWLFSANPGRNLHLRFGDLMKVDLDLQPGQQPHGWCRTHKSWCGLGVEPARAGSMQVSVEAAGPTCCPFSVAGLQKKVPPGVLGRDRYHCFKGVVLAELKLNIWICWQQENDERYSTHKAWMKHRRLNQEDPLPLPLVLCMTLYPVVPVGGCLQDIVFFENTPGYEERLLESELGWHHWSAAVGETRLCGVIAKEPWNQQWKAISMKSSMSDLICATWASHALGLDFGPFL